MNYINLSNNLKCNFMNLMCEGVTKNYLKYLIIAKHYNTFEKMYKLYVYSFILWYCLTL